LADRTFLVGPNACGKSNFLDVFRFLRDIVQHGGLQNAVENRGGLSKIRCLAARRHPDIVIEIELADEAKSTTTKWVYHLALCQEPRGHRRPLVAKEEVLRNGGLLLSRPNSEDEQDELRLTQTHLEQVTANREFRSLADFFRNTLYLHVVPQLIRSADTSSPAEALGDPFVLRAILDPRGAPELVSRSGPFPASARRRPSIKPAPSWCGERPREPERRPYLRQAVQ